MACSLPNDMPTYLGKLLMNVGGHLRIGDLTRQAKVGGSFGRLRNPPSGNHSREWLLLIGDTRPKDGVMEF